jgi:hypothetical protein
VFRAALVCNEGPANDWILQETVTIKYFIGGSVCSMALELNMFEHQKKISVEVKSKYETGFVCTIFGEIKYE